MKIVRSVCLEKPLTVHIKETTFPVKKDNEVLIKVEAMGICGSDIGAYRGSNPLVSYPRILGHEIVGTVLEAGQNMPANINVGDRVVIEPYIYCGKCYPCSIGRTNCCESLKVLGVHIDGGMQEVISHPAHLIIKAPDIPLEHLALAEPLTISLHAVHRTNVKSGEHVVIIGAGAIGLMAALVCKSYGAIPILIDIVEDRLNYAQKIGINYVLNANDPNHFEQIKAITKDRMAEVVIEASGANSSVKNTLNYTSFAGRIALTGWPKTETSLPTHLITFKELNIYGSRTSKGEFEEALSLLAQKKIDPDLIVSKVISFDEIPNHIKELSDYPEKYIKINAIF